MPVQKVAPRSWRWPMLREASYVDEEGRHHAVLLPDGVSDEDAAKGLPLGPPNLASLDLTDEQEVRLHNQLFSRRLFTAQDVRARRVDVVAALMATLKIDAERVVQVYLVQEVKKNGRRPGPKQRTVNQSRKTPRR